MGTRMAVVTLALAVALPALAAPPKSKKGAAPADKNEELARSFYKTGIDLYESGEFIEAARQFERALEKAPKQSAFMYNIASAYDKGGERKRAIEWYGRYVTVMPESKEVGVARARMAILEREEKELSAARAPAAAAATAPKRTLPPALPFVEPTTKHTYQTLLMADGKPFTLVGAGARKYFGFKVYAMGLYVDDEAARAAFPKLAAQAGGSDKETLLHSDLAAKFIVLGDFDKIAIVHFVRDVKAKDTRDSYRDSLKETFSDRAPSDLRRDGEAFLALFDDVKEGQDIIIKTTVDGQISVETMGKKRLGPKNQRLAHDVWDIWLGARPISADLKKTILDRIDTLGR